MYYKTEFDIHDFEFWSGAKDTLAELTPEEIERVGVLINELFSDDAEIPTETAINDFVWFSCDEIAEYLGYGDFDELMSRQQE